MEGGYLNELDGLLDLLGRRQFLFEAFHTGPDQPELLVAVRYRGGCADVLIMFSEEQALAYRVPIEPGVDVYAPTRVLWCYAHTAVWTLRALLTLPAPGHRDAPRGLIHAPRGLGIPAEGRTPSRRRPRKH